MTFWMFKSQRIQVSLRHKDHCAGVPNSKQGGRRQLPPHAGHVAPLRQGFPAPSRAVTLEPQTHSFYFLCHSLVNTLDTTTFLPSNSTLFLWHKLQASPFKPDWSWHCASPWLQAEAVVVGTTHKWKAPAARRCSGGRQWLLKTAVPPNSSPVPPWRTLVLPGLFCVLLLRLRDHRVFWAGMNPQGSNPNSWRSSSCETSSERWMSPGDEKSFTKQKVNFC